MSEIKFTEQESLKMRQVYENQETCLVDQLKHVRSVLSNLRSLSDSGEMIISLSQSRSGVLISKTSIGGRGRKAKYGHLIVEILEREQKPVLFREIVREVSKDLGVNMKDSARAKSFKAAMNQSGFRLRTVRGLVDTYRPEGKKSVYMGLSEWFSGSGLLREEFLTKIK